MPGSLSIEKVTRPLSSFITRRNLLMLAAMAGVGALAGLLATARLHLGLPGHKALLWMTPIVAAGLLSRARGGATIGATVAALATFAAGGNFAGSILYLPLVSLAGAVLDLGSALGGKATFTWYRAVPAAGLAGLLANLLCFVHRLGSPMPRAPVPWTMPALWANLLTYALFGLAAGILGAALASVILALRRR